MTEFDYDIRLHEIIEVALAEDIGRIDLTSNLLIPEDYLMDFAITAKEELLLSGLDIAYAIFNSLCLNCDFKPLVKDGDRAVSGDVIAKISGSARGILTAERTALNFLQRMSGVASLTKKFVEQILHTECKLLDTRKTMPGMRELDKYSVKIGGGYNHRMRLDDGILIKDNHIIAVGSIKKAVEMAVDGRSNLIKIEIECETVKQVLEALEVGVDQIMLDNMNLNDIKKSVDMVSGKLKLEVSGGVTLENIKEIAETGVDFISVGAITNSARSLDISLDAV